MTDKILFQQDRLTVTDAKITVGNVTVFFPSVSAISVYEGRPFLAMGIMSVVGLFPSIFMLFMGSRLFGAHFPVMIMAVTLLPLIAMGIFGFTYRVNCLFLGIDGSSVAVLKSKDRSQLDVAQRAIEEAKRAYETRGK
jgi:hypothetical protein